MALAKKDVHAECGKPLDRIMRSNLCAHAAEPTHDVSKFNSGRRGFNPELARFRHGVRCAGSTNKGLGRHATIVQAVAAHEMPLNQRHARAQNRRPGCRYQAGGPCSHHYQAVPSCRFWIHPVRGMNIFDQSFIEFVSRLHLQHVRRIHCRLPPQLEPAPAVQPKQCLSVAMPAPTNSVKFSTSQIVLPLVVSMSSIWLKSQS